MSYEITEEMTKERTHHVSQLNVRLRCAQGLVSQGPAREVQTGSAGSVHEGLQQVLFRRDRQGKQGRRGLQSEVIGLRVRG